MCFPPREGSIFQKARAKIKKNNVFRVGGTDEKERMAHAMTKLKVVVHVLVFPVGRG